MAKLFIPTDRVGLESFQKRIGGASTAINELLRNQIAVDWHTNPLRLKSTAMWPEGHLYQSGFSLIDSEATRAILKRHHIIFEEVEELPEGNYQLHEKKIAVYDGKGAGRDFSDPLVEVLGWGGFKYKYISDADIRNGNLMDYDILVVPGSPDAGECYYAGLGDLGLENIRNFIAKKGQYLGVCGGAYLPLTAYNDANCTWLNVVEATDTEDLDYWRTGSGLVRCRMDDASHPIFSGMTAGVKNSLDITYWEGPVITIKGSNIKPLAHFERLLASGRDLFNHVWDFRDNEMVSEALKTWHNPISQAIFDDLLADQCAFAEADYNGHKILMYSPHPEMGNIGYGPRKETLNFLLLYNGLFYLSA